MSEGGAPAVPLTSIDWSRLAEPQADEYDTDVVLRLVSVVDKRDKREGPAASARRDSIWFDVSPVYAGRPDFERDFAGYINAAADHPIVPQAVSVLGLWPRGAAQAKRLIHALHAAIDPLAFECEGSVASSSHSYEDAFGTMWATVDSPVALVEAIVHEMAHHKLRVLGVGFTAARRIVVNLAEEQYPSPILGGRRRPMPAILHAEYALLHMVALEVSILAAGGQVRARPFAVEHLRRHLALIEQSEFMLQRNLVVDQYGASFMHGMQNWRRRLVSEARMQT
jgi:hypothetical protein